MPARNRRKRGGRWQARYVGSDGRERSRTFDTRAEAERFLTQVRAQLLAGDWLDPSMGRVTFGRWLWSWWRARLLEETTRAAQLTFAKNHVLPALTDRPLAGITTHEVREWVAGLVERGLSPASVAKC